MPNSPNTAAIDQWGPLPANPKAGKRHYEVRDAAGKVVQDAAGIADCADFEGVSRKRIALRERDELIQHWDMPGCVVHILPASVTP